jgi:hypothetical protein
VQNLLSEHYFEAFGYPSMPLTFRAGVKLNIGGAAGSFALGKFKPWQRN